jgi:tetratricopeptide (TPR) repeat protein
LEDFGLHDKLEIGNREFHVHTGTLIENNKILSEVFEKGMFLISREYDLHFRSNMKSFDYEFLNSKTQKFHHQVLEELEALYDIESRLMNFRHPKSHYRLGMLFLRRNLYEEAIGQFKVATEQEDSFIQAYLGLGVGYLKASDYQNSIEIFEKVFASTSKYPDVLNFYGLAQLFLGNCEKAISLFKDAIQLNPNYVECQFNLGIALYKSALDGSKDPKGVALPARVSIYLKQVRELPKYRGKRWQKEFTKILELLQENHHDVILPQLEEFQLELVDMITDKDKIYEFYLRFLFGGKDFDKETLDFYQHYFEYNTQNNDQYPDYWNDQGIFNLIKSRSYYLKAITEFEKALTISAKFNDARHNLEKIKSNEKGFMILLRAILK